MYCLIAGDSIAYGLGEYFHQCDVHAQIGIGAAAIVGRVADADVVVLSAGSNDETTPQKALLASLEAMRAKVTGTVIWVVPQNTQHAADAVRDVASRHGDKVATFHAGHDGTHPRNWTELSNNIKKVMPNAHARVHHSWLRDWLDRYVMVQRQRPLWRLWSNTGKAE